MHKKKGNASKEHTITMEQLLQEIVEGEPNQMEPEVNNEMELEQLTLLRQTISDLEEKITGLPSSHPDYAVDYKLLIILQTFLKRLETNAGRIILQKEADKHHQGNIFKAEKSFIHTFRQSLLLRTTPPTTKRLHQRKNSGIISR